MTSPDLGPTFPRERTTVPGAQNPDGSAFGYDMQPPDRGAESPAAANDIDLSKDALVGALESLYLAYQKTSIYPSGHPSIPQALAGAIAGIEEALSEDESLIVGVAHDQFLLDARPLCESSGALKALALMFHDLDVATLEFDRGMVLAELERFIQELGSASRRLSRAGVGRRAGETGSRSHPGAADRL